MAKPKALLSNLVIEEVALCREGMNPDAHIKLYKRRAPVEKFEDIEAQTFAEVLEGQRAQDIENAIDQRIFALSIAQGTILHSDESDKQGLIVAAINDFAAAMERDVPDLFAGRLAKQLIALAAESRPSDDDVQRVVKAELDAAGYLAESKEETVEFLTSLNKDERAALEYVLGATSLEDFCKGMSEEQGAAWVALAKRAVAASAAEAELEKAKADLEKAQNAPPPDGTSLDAILKGVKDPSTRAYLEAQDAAIKKGREETTALVKAARKRELDGIAKSFDALPQDGLVVVLEKADASEGLVELLVKLLTSANAQAKKGRAFDELGIDTIPGEGSVGTVDEADQALVGKAAELRKGHPELTAAQAYVRACEDNPELYAATRQYRPGTVGAN